MNNSSKQNINFLEVLPIRYDRIPSIFQIFLAWVVFSAFMYILHLLSASNHSGLMAVENEIKKDLEYTIGFLGESHKHEGDQAQAGKIVAISDEELKLDNDGFVDNLIALSQYGIPEVWFTSLVFSHEKNEIKLTGLTASTKALNNFFRNIKNHKSFKDKNLVLKDVRRSINLDKVDGYTHGFVITGSFS